MNTDENAIFSLPEYIKVVYGDLYASKKNCKMADSSFSCMLRTFFKYDFLVERLIEEIKGCRNILQIGISFGYQIQKTSALTRTDKVYKIIDINPNEVVRLQKKCAQNYKNLIICEQDARQLEPEKKYDCIICFFLLSTLPNETRNKIINNALKVLEPDGKAVFIDWHKPASFNPLLFFVKSYNRLRHPFVEHFWKKDIPETINKDFAKKFLWKKTCYFGGLFQKTVVKRNFNSESLLEKF